MVKVLFVCLGNICRSPLAKAVFEYHVEKAGGNRTILIDSCGTSGFHIGEDADERAVQIANHYKVPMSHRARQLKISDLKDFDYIVAMDRQNAANIRKLARENNIQEIGLYLMREFDPESGQTMDVPDPYYGGIEGFHEVYRILDRASKEFLQFIQINHQ
jgi:protein-tyrosine phosphatase